MMKTLLKTITIVLFSLMVKTVKAQDSSYTCLGVLCCVNVNLSSDPVGGDGYLTYTIPTPSEELYNYGVQGPGSPLLTNNLGNTVDLKLRRALLVVESDGRNCELPIDILVKKWSNGWGSYTTTPPTSGNYAQCYYTVRLLITQ